MKRYFAFAAGALLAATVSYAQNQSSDNTQLEEVVVTAEKRAENLQKVSISIQVKSGEELRTTGKRRIDEIMEGTVGIQAQGSPTGTAFYIRGVEPAGAGRGTPVTTPIIIDGVAQNRTESVRGGSLDVAQVEVMRGPQSTALGANSLSGAISLVSNKPVFEYYAAGTLELGNYSKQSVEGVLNVPLSNTQALRFAYSNDRRDGYYNSNTGDTDTQIARVKYRIQPSDSFDAVLTLQHQKIGGNGSEIGVRSSGRWVPYSAAGAVSCANPNPVAYVDFIGCPITYVLVNDGTNFRTRADAWNDGLGRYGWGWESGQDTTIDQANLELTWSTRFGDVVIQPSFQKAHTKTTEAPMGVSGAGFAKEDIRENTMSLDARINGNTIGKLQWQAGIRYNKDDYGNNLFIVTTEPGGMGCPLAVRCYSYAITPDQVSEGMSEYFNGQFSVTDQLRLIGGLRYNNDKASVAELQAAGFPPFIAGDINGPFPASVAAATTARGSRSWSKLTYRAGFEWDVLPDTMLYATYSTGYTPGTVNGMTLNGTDEVTLKQISAGWKSQWLDNRLQFNGEYFATTFFNRSAPLPSSSVGGATTCNFAQAPPGVATGVNGLEVIAGVPAGACARITGTVQIPEIASNGVDMDLTWLISEADRLVLSAEWLDTKYDKRPIVVGGFNASSTASILTAVNAANNTISAANAQALAASLNDTFAAVVGVQLQNAPKTSATLSYSHDFSLGSRGQFTPRLEATYKDTYWSVGELGVPGAPLLSTIVADRQSLYWQPSYTKWDLYGTWSNADGKLNVTGYVKNLNNEVIMTAFGQAVLLAAPRTVGVTISATF